MRNSHQVDLAGVLDGLAQPLVGRRPGLAIRQQLADLLRRYLESFRQARTVYGLRFSLTAFPTGDGGRVHPYSLGQAFLAKPNQLAAFGKAVARTTHDR
jgi:hypothetical protein